MVWKSRRYYKELANIALKEKDYARYKVYSKLAKKRARKELVK